MTIGACTDNIRGNSKNLVDNCSTRLIYYPHTICLFAGEFKDRFSFTLLERKQKLREREKDEGKNKDYAVDVSFCCTAIGVSL
jgi:hypothetical protein